MGGQRVMEVFWGQSSGFVVMVVRRSFLKNIRFFKVKVSLVKLLVMVEMVEWIGIWKSFK